MDSILEWLTAPLSRTFKIVVMPIIAVVLVTLFVFLGFPYDLVADRALGAIEQQTGATIRYGSLSPRLTIGGPGFKLRQVDVITPGGRRFLLDPMHVRPAWSMGWITGEPALRIDVVSEHGDLAGVATVGRAFGWDGRIRELDLSVIPSGLVGGVDLAGRADIEAELMLRDGVAEGEIDIQARSGEIGHPAIPIPIEFDSAEGRMLLGGGKLAVVETLELEGPLVAIVLSGEVGQAEQAGREPIDASIDLTVREAGLQQMARNLGLKLDAQGRVQLEVGGTLGVPELR